MQRPAVAKVDEVEAAEAKRCGIGLLTNFRDAGAEHAAAPDVFAILVVHVMRRVERAQPLRAGIGVCDPAVGSIDQR